MTVKAKTKVWGLFHDRVGYQIYRQSVTNPKFWYDPQDRRWLEINIGELLKSFDNEDEALTVKTDVEAYEKANRQEMLEAFQVYNREKTKLEDAIRLLVDGYIKEV